MNVFAATCCHGPISPSGHVTRTSAAVAAFSAAASSSDFAIAPFIPREPGVSTSFAPRATSTLRRSMLIVSGITSTHS